MTGSAAPDASPLPRHGWFIHGLGLGQICSWGSIYYSFPLIAQAMSEDLHWSKTELFSAATTGLILAGLLSYPVGKAIDRGQGRAVLVGGSVLAGLLLAVWACVDSFVAYLVVATLVGGLQAALLYEPVFAVVVWRLGAARARRGITALTLWGGFASTVFVPLTQWAIDHGGWRGALLTLAAVNVFVCTLLYRTAIGRPSSLDPSALAPGAPPDATPPAKRASTTPGSALPGSEAAMWASVLRRPVFWALALAILAHAATFSALTFHLYPLLIERKLDATDVVIALSLIGPSQVLGRVLVGALAAKQTIQALGVAVVAAFPLAVLALLVLPTTLLVAAGALVLYGAANGIFTIVRGLAVPEMVSSEHYGAINGAMTSPATWARAVAPVGIAALWGLHGNYDAPMVAMFGGALVLMLSFWSAARFANRERAVAAARTRPGA